MAKGPPTLARVSVGTSGWSYPSWRPDFYPAGTDPSAFLGFYARQFPTVELNTTGYRLPAELPVNLYQLTPEELLTEGIVALPGSLGEAIYEAERSELVAATLGEHVFEWFIRNKKAEWQEYIAQVTQWEVARYLPML